MKLVSNLIKNRKNIALNLAVSLIPAAIIAPFVGVVLFAYGIMPYGLGSILTIIICTPLLALCNPIAPLKRLAKALHLRPMTDEEMKRFKKHVKATNEYACDTINNPIYHNMSGNIYNRRNSGR